MYENEINVEANYLVLSSTACTQSNHQLQFTFSRTAFISFELFQFPMEGIVR
jgi:hypothetical protein